MKKICVFIGSRANYSSIKSLMVAVAKHPDLELQLVIGASAILDRFGSVINLIKQDGFEPNFTFHNIIEGESPTTMAKSTGLGTIEMAMVLDNLNPDYVVVVGDRFEMMSITIAAAYMNIKIIHTMGGEVTGTIDESIRHAITKFSHVHFPANEDARSRIIKMGEDPNYVFNVGCPRIDLVAEELKLNSSEILGKLFNEYRGVGPVLDISNGFLLVSQHPVTTEYGMNRNQINETLLALEKFKIPTIMLWPNIDAGSDDISRGIRVYREQKKPQWLHVFKNLPTQLYIHLMKETLCLIGNSSSGVREGAFIGTPVINIGTRQNKRMSGENAINTGYDAQKIKEALKRHLNIGKYASSPLYGSGDAGPRMANIIADIDPPIQKTICY